MKVIFLDFDGVILTLRTALAYGTSWSAARPDPVIAEALRRCCENGVKIVVSSTWRTMSDMCTSKLDEAGLQRFLHRDWRTKDFQSTGSHTSRPKEISDWVERNRPTDYRILDDDPWRWTSEQKPRVLECHPEDGLSARGLQSLLEWAEVKRGQLTT